MTVTSFKDARRENAENGPFLDTGHFAEPLALTPASGEIRTVIGHVVEDTTAAPQREDGGADEVESIWVKVLRSTTTAKSGIPEPAFGDSITREGDDRPYSYAGDMRAVTPHTWQLRFTRAKPAAYQSPGRRR